MAERANISGGYLGRLALVGAVCVGFSLWSIYDGAVKYPKKRIQAEKYLEFKESESESWEDDWYEHATSQGWSTDDPGKPEKYNSGPQYVMAALTAAIALIFLTKVFLNRGCWIESDESGLTASWGPRCEFESIAALDKKKWRNKGIAVVRYGDGKNIRRLVLDDCKYDPDATEVLLREVEEHLDDEQIVGGPRQPPPESELDEEETVDPPESNEPDNV